MPSAGKRGASPAPVGPRRKVARSPGAANRAAPERARALGRPADVEAKCNAIAGALMLAQDLPLPLRQMLCGQLEGNLGVPVEERHRHQETVNDMVEETLVSVQRFMRTQLEVAEAEVQTLKAERVKLEAAHGLAKEKAVAKAEAVASQKASASEAAAAAEASLATMEEAERLQETTTNELTDARQRADLLDGALRESLELLREGSLVPEEVERHVKSLAEIAERFDFGTAMQTSIPAALPKAPAERGMFDNVVFEHVEEALKIRISSTRETIERLTAKAEPLADKTRTAQAAHAMNAEAEEGCRAVLKVAQMEHREADASLKAAAKALRDATPAFKSAQTNLETERSSLQAIEEEVLVAFAELRHFTQIPVPEGSRQLQARSGISSDAPTSAAADAAITAGAVAEAGVGSSGAPTGVTSSSCEAATATSKASAVAVAGQQAASATASSASAQKRARSVPRARSAPRSSEVKNRGANHSMLAAEEAVSPSVAKAGA
eukprot:TRINITY_DN1606_c0_g2_i1.p1 TRINITY_DN1606_c0_g2~~TRINITY_DN1606_c0_g2_i1.p1  ORF type:complete len:496 (-),score=127.16 TRINITY_DN1606_c0_g2_i1:245-1732(-)